MVAGTITHSCGLKKTQLPEKYILQNLKLTAYIFSDTL
jgi:hypothetical protein